VGDIEIPSKKPSLDVLYEATRYSLDTEWDLFKHYDSKASTLLAASTTILSIYIGVQIFIINLIEWPNSLFTTNFYRYVLTIIIIIFFSVITSRHLLGAIWAALDCLKQVEFKRVPNPVRLKEVFFDKTDLDAKVSILKEMIESWLKNHDVFNVKKARSIISSFYHLRLGIMFLIISIVIDGMLLSIYRMFFGGI